MPAIALDPAERADSTRWRAVGQGLRRLSEAQRGRMVLWFAPALAAGSGWYYALPEEPGLFLALMIACLAFAFFWFGRSAPLLALAAAMAVGFALAKFQVERATAPLLAAVTGEVAVTGRVQSVERVAGGRMVMLLAPHSIAGIAASDLPARLRLSFRAHAGSPPAGAAVSLAARLAPLPAPVEPGGFDYGRKLWLEGVGGTGRVTSATIIHLEQHPAATSASAWIAGLRSAMGSRIHAALAEPYASFAEALITGERSSIPPEINRSLLTSGLYHILSISGLHMWLVAGGVFWAVRAALALVPGLALRFPLRKWAAGAALIMALFYMLLADGGIATARSFIMVAIVFFAVIVDRPALSMRNLALAAIIVLLADPAAAVEAGFQMSFLAVLGLIAFYEAWARYRRGQEREEVRPRHWAWRLAIWALAAMAASLATSVIAGFSSSLPAVYHFGRVSPYGVLANGLAIPVVGILVMPFGLAAALLMPFGLETLPLVVMGKGLELVVVISDAVAGLPGASAVLARPPAAAMLTIAAGFVLLCLLSGPARLLGPVVMLAGGMLALAAPPPPDLLVEGSGRNMAIRDGSGLLVPAQSRRARFAVEKWLLANGEEVGPGDAAKRPGWRCEEGRCLAEVKGRRVLYVTGGEGRPLSCAGVAVLVADFPLRGACRSVPLRIDRFDLWREGAHAVTFTGGEVRVSTSRGAQGRRPWVVEPRPRRTLLLPAGDHPLD